MPNYDYYCPACGNQQTIYKPMSQYKDIEVCKRCSTELIRDYNKHGFHCGNKSYGKPLISEALGIHPDQAADHRKQFPNIGIMPEGQLKFESYQAHNKYLKAVGWGKHESKRMRKSNSR